MTYQRLVLLLVTTIEAPLIVNGVQLLTMWRLVRTVPSETILLHEKDSESAVFCYGQVVYLFSPSVLLD